MLSFLKNLRNLPWLNVPRFKNFTLTFFINVFLCKCKKKKYLIMIWKINCLKALTQLCLIVQ